MDACIVEREEISGLLFLCAICQSLAEPRFTVAGTRGWLRLGYRRYGISDACGPVQRAHGPVLPCCRVSSLHLWRVSVVGMTVRRLTRSYRQTLTDSSRRRPENERPT